MRLKHIYITKEGEPMANPEMEYPENPKDKELVPKIQKIWKHSEDLAKYHSGLLPFEDRDLVIKAIKVLVRHIRPDTLIPVDLEVEVVEVCANCGKPRMEHSFSFKPKKVLRIKP